MPTPFQNLLSRTDTPAAAGKLLVTATFDASGSGSDWGTNRSTRLFVVQNGVETLSDPFPMSVTRQSQVARAVFTVAAGLPVEWGLYADLSGAVACTWNNVHITAELIKG